MRALEELDKCISEFDCSDSFNNEQHKNNNNNNNISNNNNSVIDITNVTDLSVSQRDNSLSDFLDENKILMSSRINNTNNLESTAGCGGTAVGGLVHYSTILGVEGDSFNNNTNMNYSTDFNNNAAESESGTIKANCVQPEQTTAIPRAPPMPGVLSRGPLVPIKDHYMNDYRNFMMKPINR